MKIFNLKKLVAFTLTVLFLMQQTMILPVMAESNITGVTPGADGQYNIRPDFANGDFGFKHYGDFHLDKGDVANLIFALKNGQDIGKFVNLVDNRIIINGVLNGILSNGNIGGHAIFVSPNGMVVGASGVLNVGSLTAIAPTQQAYLKYISDSAIGSALPEGYTHENNLAVLKASDMGSDITINGKIIARGDVELVAQTINVGNTADNKAGIVAGVDNNAVTNANQIVNQKLATTEAAGKLFDALVKNDVKNGTGFAKDAQGNIVIKAQSIKTVTAPTLGDKLVIAGKEFILENLTGPLVDEYGNVLDTTLLPKELQDLGITAENVQAALETWVRDSIPSDATNSNAHNDTNYATVNINNAVLKGNNVDISATSKADYIAQKDGNMLFDKAYSSAIGQIIEGSITGDGFDFEGARAKAEVTIGDGAEIIADNDVKVSSLAVANTSIKTGSKFVPMVDTGEEYYYTLGSKTVSTVNVNNGAEITAGNNVKIQAQSQNSLNVKLKNPTSAIGQVAGGNTGIPSIQVLFLKSTLEADTTAAINKGAIINAANVEVDAVNVSSDLSNINSIAGIGEKNAGIAVAITLKDTKINTSATIDSTINTNGDGEVSVNAQNLHMASNTSQATVDPKDPKVGRRDKTKFNILKLLTEKLAGLIDTSILSDTIGSYLPNVSTSLVVNDSTINTTAKIGSNANIHADNVSVNANTVDLTVNTAKSHVKDAGGKDSKAGGGVSDYIPNPGVAVIVNNQTNNTTAIIEDGTASNHANVTADNKLSVNATTEMPRNSATFDLILNVIQAGGDLVDLPDDLKGNVNAELGKGDQWDIRLLLQGIMNPTAEIGAEIADIKFAIKNGGIKNNLGLQGFFNNWAETTSSAGSGVGVAASVIDSSVTNNTVARIGDYSNVEAGNVTVNAANQVVQYNAAGDVAKLWKITDGASGAKSGVGGNVVIESVESNAKAQVGDNAVITVKENQKGDDPENKTDGTLNIQAANQQDFLTAVVTGSKATGDNGVAISGSVTVQDVSGTTEASLGASKVKASVLNIKAGEAELATAQTSEGYLFHKPIPKKDENGNIIKDENGDPIYEESNPFEDLNAEDYEVSLDPDLSSPQISNYTGVDSDTGLLVLNESNTIKDGISNILISGAIASETAKVSGGEGESKPSSSSGGAFGASVNVSEFHRNVNAIIADGADIEVSKDLNVIADSYTQSLDIAIAGAFAGGVKLSKKSDKKDTESGFAGNNAGKADGLLSKVSDLFDKVADKLGSTNTTVGSDANPSINVGGTDYTAGSDGVYRDQNGNALTASNGDTTDNVKFQGSTGKEAANLDNLDSDKGHSKNISAAAAGSVNVQLNESTVNAEIGNAKITVGNKVNVEANQTTKSLNVGGGVAKAATVGAGAAVNFVENTNQTTAAIKGADITFTGKSDNLLNVKAEENNDNVQVAIGVGVTKTSADDANTAVSAGGSFNTDILENKVTAQLDNTTVKHADNLDNIAVNVNAENHSASYKGAGGMAVNVAQKGNNAVGAGMGGNLNIISKETTAKISNNSDIKNAKSVDVVANKDKNEKTEDLISVGVGGTVVTGATNGYTFSGAMATDVIDSSITATVEDSKISSVGDVNVAANNNFSNGNIAGALGFSTAAKGVGVGVGAIVSVINNSVNASVNNSTISKANNVNVDSYNNEDLKFLAVNMGVQTKDGSAVGANGIVNVIQNDIAASVIDSNITNDGNLSIVADYDNSIHGITGVGEISIGSGVAVGANVLSNTLLSSNTAQLISSDTDSKGKLTVKATTDEDIDIVPVAMAATVKGNLSAAANVGVNVVQNSTAAKIDSKEGGKKSTVSANGVDVIAEDNTHSRSRGGTLAAAGGNAAVGGSILADVYIKNVDAHIDNTTISNGGDIKVEASAKNIFGEETPGSITAADLVDKLGNGSYDIEQDGDYENWDMTFDISGANKAGISGSLISKNVINDVDSYIGSNVIIEKAGNIDVKASNTTVADVIVGNISAGGSAAVGGSIFSNVNVSTVDAGIKNGAQLGSSESKVGNVNVEARSEQTYKSIMAIIGGAGTAAVNGSVNSNVIVNSTNAYIENNVNLYSSGTLTVDASDSMDVESLNVGVSAAGTASLGGVAYVNVLANKVNSQIGIDGADGERNNTISADKDILVNASDDQNFLANVALVSASGTAAVDLIGIANVMASEINAGIKNTTITSNEGSITVKAENSFNGKHKNQTTGLESLLGKDSVAYEDISELIPLVGIVSVGASGTAAVGGSVIANVVTTTVNAYVDNSSVSTANGLNVDADSSMTTYEAALSIAASGVAAVGLNGVTNVYSGSTTASVTNSDIQKGSVNVSADDEFNLNTLIFTTTVSGTAAVTAITNVNTISNNVTAKIENTDIKNADSVEVSARNAVKSTGVLAAGAIAGTGAGVNVAPVVNVFTNKTEAYIKDGSIDNADIDVNAQSDIDVIAGVLGVSGSGVGASVSGFADVNVFDNDLNAYINNADITNAKSTSVNASADLTLDGFIGSVGVNGVGGGVLVNGIVNVIKNNVNAYIADSSIQGGSVSVSAEQETNIDNDTATTAVNGVGAAVSANALVSVFENNLNAFISNTSVSDVSDISVNTENKQDIKNVNIGAVASGTAAAAANTIVNVIENSSRSYIDAKDKTMDVNGEISVSAADTILMNNTMGLVAGSGFGSGGANVNVNVINNAVTAEVLSSSKGQINAGSLNVNAGSVIGIDESAVSAAAAGFGAIAGTVFINSIGGKVDFSGDSNLDNAGIEESLAQAGSNFDSLVDGIEYQKGGESQSLDGTLDLKDGDTKGGTTANINANVKTTDENGITVTAQNTLKGYDSDTLSITNATTAGGAAAAGVGVLVTDMKYNTTASISGGNIVTENGDITIDADSTVKANTDAIAATVGAVSIAGNVAYFKNNAVTNALVQNAVITAGDMNITADSVDNIVSNAISGTIGGGTVNLGIAVAGTENEVNALINGSDVEINADNLNILATNTSTLESKMYGASISGIGVNVFVNQADSNAVTNALIALTSGNVNLANNLNIAAQTNGISVINNVVMGSVGFAGANANAQIASADASFNAGVSGGDVTAKNVKIKAGTKKGSDDAGKITAEVKGVNANVTAYQAGTTYLNAEAKGNATAQITGGKVTSENGIDLISKLDREAKSSSESFGANLINIGALVIKTLTGGSTNINTKGGTLVANNGDITMNAVSNNLATADSVSANLSLASGSGSSLSAESSSNSEIFVGNVEAKNGNVKAKIDNKQTAKTGSKSGSVSLANVSGTTISAKTGGSSVIKGRDSEYTGTATGNEVTYEIVSNAAADANMEKGSISLAGAEGTDISAEAGANANIDAGNINANKVNLKTNVTRNATITDKNASLSLIGLKTTNLTTKATGNSGVSVNGTIQNKAGNGKSDSVVISATDKSLAKNDSATSSYGFVSGSSLNITSTADSSITNNIGGTIKAQDLDVTSTLDRTAQSNAASSSAGLVGIGSMTLLSQIGNGTTTTFTGTIDAGSFDVNSVMKNTVESYVKDFSAGLVALSSGSTTNKVHSTTKNTVNFNNNTESGVVADTINATVDTLTSAYLFKESGNYGVFVIKGGPLTNELNASSELNFNSAKIKTAGDANFDVINNAYTPSEMQVTDDAGGFIADTGATLKNTLQIGASINVNGDTDILAGDHLKLDIESGTTGFKQSVKSNGSGFTAHNHATSIVEATINNAININRGVLSAKHVDINMNSSNELSSIASVNTHHFAGQPSVESRVDLTINNTLTVGNGGELYAQSSDANTEDTNININFMGNSTQNITQDAWLYVEAAVATGDTDGGIDFVTNNKIDIKQGGKISSQKDINVVFDKGVENLSSRIAYDKVSRLLFGIKIHDKDDYSSVSNRSNNEVDVNGKLSAGKNNSMHLTINKDGSVTEDSTLKEGAHFTKNEHTVIEAGKDSEAAKEEIKNIEEALATLEAEKDRLEKVNETNTENYNTLQEQIDALKAQLALAEYLEGVEDTGKISQNDFLTSIIQMLKDNNVENPETVANQLLDYYTMQSGLEGDTEKLPIFSLDSEGNAILKYATDENGNYIKLENGLYELDGYEYVYDDKGNPIKVVDENGKESALYTLTFENFIDNIGINTNLDSSALQTDLSGLASVTVEGIESILNDYFVSDAKNAANEIYNSCFDSTTGKFDSAKLQTALNGLKVDEQLAQDSLQASLNGMEIKTETATIKTDSGSQEVTFLTYDGKIIYDEQYIENKDSVSAKIEATKENAQEMNDIISSVNDKINDLAHQIEQNEARKDDIAQNGLGSFSAENGSFVFNDINATSGTINIQANKGSSYVHSSAGTGEIIMSVADVLIDNNSNYNLIFGDITVGGGAGSFIIDHNTVSANPYNGIKITTSGTEGNKGAITINTWYDQNDPENNTVLGSLPSNMIFNGVLNTAVGNVNIFNESGDVTINDTITSLKTTVNVSQGSFTQDTKGKDYVLNKGDTLFAGKNIDIKASKITVEGDMQAGVANKNITITEEMLANAKQETVLVEKLDENGQPVKDENGNTIYEEKIRWVVDLASGRDGSEGTKQSDYMYDKNNIKAIYDPDTKTVTLYGVKVTDEAGIKLTATKGDDAVVISDNSTLKYADGYGTIKIDNQTDAHLVVNGLENNKIAGAVTVNNNVLTGDNIINTVDPSVKDGKITVDTSKNGTKGDLIVNGLVSSGNLNAEESGLLLQTNGNLVINNRVAAAGSDYQVPTIDTKGDIVFNKLTENGGVIIQGLIQNTGNIDINNEGSEGIVVAAKGFIDNKNGKVSITNNNGNIKIAGKVNNASDAEFDGEKDIVITNDSADGGIITAVDSEIKNNGGNIDIINNGTEGINASGNIIAAKGDINITNRKGDINFTKDSSISLNNGYASQENNINIINEETAENMTIAGAVNNYGSGNINIHNKGAGFATIAQTAVISNNTGNMLITNENDKLTVAGTVNNAKGDTKITNNGENGIDISGIVENTGGIIDISNNNTAQTSGIKITTTGRIISNDGNIYIKNFGTRDIGLDIEGIVKAIKQNIEITNENSDIEIGEYDSDNDFYLTAQNGNIIISQTNGDILNGVKDPDTGKKHQNHDSGNPDKAYKTLISSNGNLTMNVNGGNIGSDTHALDGKESGFGVNASTRDYTESINIKVNGVVNAKAENNGNALINIRAKESNLNVDNITSDGNVMLTAADWKQADKNPTPNDDSYFHGYSIVNKASDKSKANVTGRNISLIASDNLGAEGNAFTYNQLEGGSISAMAENDLYIKGMGISDNIWQLITKRGNMGLEFEGDAVIRELTAGKKLKIVSKGANLTIYDLGKTTNLADDDDMLFPHDQIKMSSVAPETIDIRVLDINPDTRVNPNEANSTINIYNAYVKGQSNGKADVTLRADNVIAHAYEAASSNVSNSARPNGFDATKDRTYANDYMNPDADKNLKATGFNTVGKGDKLVFDIQGVSPDDVINAGGKESDRNYKPQEVVQTWEIFNNPIGFKETVYKAKDVTLSLNSSSTAPTDNRGMEISKIYTDNAYIDTKDLNLHISDAFITNYAEFRNGNRGGEGGGHFIGNDYRWLTIVDNDYYRNISNDFGIPVTSQLYTKLTGSFALNMGNVIALETKAPVVHYNPYEVIILPRTENSFYRLTYKDDKIQKTTTTPEFDDIDKSTYKPTKRDSIRFEVAQGDGYVNVSDKKDKKGSRKRIIAIENISRGGLAVVHDGSLKKGERFVIDLDYHNIKASPEVEVVRVVNDKAGLKFINMDKATANKILYMNMYMAETTSPQMSKK